MRRYMNGKRIPDNPPNTVQLSVIPNPRKWETCPVLKKPADWVLKAFKERSIRVEYIGRSKCDACRRRIAEWRLKSKGPKTFILLNLCWKCYLSGRHFAHRETITRGWDQYRGQAPDESLPVRRDHPYGKRYMGRSMQFQNVCDDRRPRLCVSSQRDARGK